MLEITIRKTRGDEPDGPAIGRAATLTVRRVRRVCRTRCATRPVGATTVRRLRLAAVRRMSLPRLLTGDSGWSVSLTAEGFTVGGVRYRAYRSSRTLRPALSR